MRSRLVPLSSPDHLKETDGNGEDIWSEQPPSDMTEMALTEELRQVQVQIYKIFVKHVPKTKSQRAIISFQEQASHVQTQLSEEELKNSGLLQQISKLEEQISALSQECDRKDEVEFHMLWLYCHILLN